MARRLSGLALAAVVVLAGCGGGDGPAPPPEEPTAGDAPPATPPQDPGAPPGTPSAPPPPDATPSPPGTPAPSTPDTTSPPGAPSVDGTPGAPTSTACAGLVPEEPGPGVEYVLERAAGPGFCDLPITDGRGEWIGVGVGLRFHNYSFVRAAAPGEARGGLNVARLQYLGDPWAPQPDGYHLAHGADGMPGRLERLDATGGVLEAGGPPDVLAIQGVPGGGSVALRVEGFPAGPLAYRLEWLDASGATRAVAPLPGPVPAFVVAANANTLVVVGDRARWFDRDGAPLTDWFGYEVSLPFAGEFVARAATLADGSVVVLPHGPEPLWFESGVPRATRPPEWVTSRAGATIATVRGGRANAFAFVDGVAPCSARIEILTPGGESCGTVRLAGTRCGAVSFGADRTVFTTHTADDGTCTWRWWSGLLR